MPDRRINRLDVPIVFLELGSEPFEILSLSQESSAGDQELSVEIELQSSDMFVMIGLLLPPRLRFDGQSCGEIWRRLRSQKSSEIDAWHATADRISSS